MRPPLALDGFHPYAVESRHGPHVTLQAGVVESDRYWTTTSRDSLKARSVRSHGVAAALVERDDDLVEVLAGSTTALDPTHPVDATEDPGAVLHSGTAVAKLACGQIEQLVGYLEARGAVPPGWLPHHRVVLATRIERCLVLDGFDVVDADGAWQPRLEDPTLRLRPDPDATGSLPRLPPELSRLVAADRPARAGFATPDGPVVLPARWRGDGLLDVSAVALSCTTAELPGPGSATFDDSSRRRPDEKQGMLLRGRVVLLGVTGPRATVALQPDRLTSWYGFDTRTVEVSP